MEYPISLFVFWLGEECLEGVDLGLVVVQDEEVVSEVFQFTISLENETWMAVEWGLFTSTIPKQVIGRYSAETRSTPKFSKTRPLTNKLNLLIYL